LKKKSISSGLNPLIMVQNPLKIQEKSSKKNFFGHFYPGAKSAFNWAKNFFKFFLAAARTRY
jgi:hypothetical protein